MALSILKLYVWLLVAYYGTIKEEFIGLYSQCCHITWARFWNQKQIEHFIVYRFSFYGLKRPARERFDFELLLSKFRIEFSIKTQTDIIVNDWIYLTTLYFCHNTQFIKV